MPRMGSEPQRNVELNTWGGKLKEVDPAVLHYNDCVTPKISLQKKMRKRKLMHYKLQDGIHIKQELYWNACFFRLYLSDAFEIKYKSRLNSSAKMNHTPHNNANFSDYYEHAQTKLN